MKLGISAEEAHWKRSLIMKVGSAVLAVHIVVACLFALTQGCVTTESQGSSRAAGARHKGPWKHEHKGGPSGAAIQSDYYDQGMGQSDDALYSDPLITSSTVHAPVDRFPSPVSVAKTQTYIVQKGDILSQLAVDFDTPTATLVALNNLADPDVLYVGQELLVPAGHSRTVKRSEPVKSQTSVKKGGTYTIKKGDTLSEIAQAAGVSINDLRALNNIKDDVIFAGDTIDIPANGKVPASREPVKEKAAPAAVKPEVVEPEPAPLAMALSTSFLASSRLPL